MIKRKRLEGEKRRIPSSKGKFARHGPLYLFVLCSPEPSYCTTNAVEGQDPINCNLSTEFRFSIYVLYLKKNNICINKQSHDYCIKKRLQ